MSTQAELETSKSLTLRIEGMDSPREVRLLEREFAGLAGVIGYDVDAASQKAHTRNSGGCANAHPAT